MQDFLLQLTESEVPSLDVQALAELLNDTKLVDIDKIKVSRKELRHLYSEKQNRAVPEHEFLDILETLKSIEVRMVDESNETDVYFIHE